MLLQSFKTTNKTWSGRVKAGKDLICYDVREMLNVDDVVDAKCDDATENYDEDYVEVYDDTVSDLSEPVTNILLDY